ncbi:cob(I)yrinic acid a,c-diamide adenosyltransferase [Tenacibaculum piscium]|uniref:Corrinoid adenosyltransferase n=1 Tax=Tenacibaculum piscium TaxID=1458515 RepID=A0A2H1YG81_9FLAO|nr:cob(I)yrinic acid a,c-diamide adenosyltransferase [Tenacibaculum piscium]MBE7629599.1 cob(I)yrinic acid a,c-diamide adenosyltransferase [Tenacibaculum piscium]MBE7670686.1 cob(I)yrinic acid a,c-diamide adenosyltransferase [Tenacibaculum piscium]MBE7685241.1 cob(I)yrinic acid a,c-diamide adenosyltransferase [Tenacibaculum piscium]MBE7690784.1 cob(I)yrinic acid a,c-diamide adenosyltransferase [Tenacibaculum piscium]SOS74488.1 Cob(I)yrinic acid a,c-diamide adenosyltransferase [Tenacibaculum pi
MKIYTKTGDKGTTALFGGTRVAKHHLRIESYGTVDELNSYIGLIRDKNNTKNIQKTLLKIQGDLFILGAMLATPPEKETLKNGKKRLNIDTITDGSIQFLEDEIDAMNADLPQMTHFILPGGHETVSFCHIARCVCRRAERLSVALHEEEAIDLAILSYLNRLSDYLFVLARKLTKNLKVTEVKWTPEKR